MPSTNLLPNSAQLLGAAPRYATPRNPAAYTEGPQVAVVARTLGTPLIPWQQLVADVSGERRADGSYEYEIVVVTVPRQCGKTTLIRAVGTQRALGGRSVFYTAQTGKDARARWAELVQLLRVNPALKNRIKIALRGGSEHVVFPSGAVFQCFAPTPESLHGYRPPTVFVDEAFAQTGGRGELLMGAFGPAQFTIVDRQIWIVSTAGTAESEWLHSWIDRAAEGMPRVALFDWGAAEDQSPYDLDDIAEFHPGVGFELDGKPITAADVLSELEKNGRAEYERAYANRRTLTTSLLISPETWAGRKVQTKPTALDLSCCVMTYDVAYDRQSATITATWSQDGKPTSMIYRHQSGTSWLTPAVDELIRNSRPLEVAAAENGPVLEITAALVAQGHKPKILSEREFATASGALLSRIDDNAIAWHASSTESTEVLEKSVTGVVMRPASVDGVAISRKHSAGDAAPAIGIAIGTHVLETRSSGKPKIRF